MGGNGAAHFGRPRGADNLDASKPELLPTDTSPRGHVLPAGKPGSSSLDDVDPERGRTTVLYMLPGDFT